MASPSSGSDSSGAVCEWEKFVDDDTKTPYYYNKRTGESSWDVPEGFVEKETEKQHADASKLPPKWRKFMDESAGKAYYYDEANEVTQWEEPEGFVENASDDDSGEEEENTDEDSEDEERAPVREALAEEPEVKQLDDEKPSNGPDDKPKEQTADADSAAPAKVDAPTEGESAPEPPIAQPNWVKHMDRASGKPYYHDTVSGKTQWEEPAGFVDAPPMSAVAAEYQAHLNRVRTERLTRVTQQVLDPTGSLGRLNAILDGINPSGGGAVTAAPADASGEDGEASAVAVPAVTGVPRAEWQQHVDPHTQRFYYHNVVTGETQWQKPDAPVVSGLADWVPPEVSDPAKDAANRKTVSGVNYAAKAKFNRITGKYEQFGGDEYWQTQGVAADRAGRQMSHFFNMTDLEKNREEAKVLKEKLKRKNIDWKKVAAEKKAKKLKQKNEWMYQD